MNADPRVPSVLQRALEYAQMGWHVFPAPPGEKKSHIKGEHANGERWGATRNPSELCAYWKRFPSANVGIATGSKSGILVVECDTEDAHGVDGIASMQMLIEQNGPLPQTIEGLSSTGSWHLYFRWPEGEDIINSASQVGPGIDVRAEGGMMIAPPSIKPGKPEPYRWTNPPGLFDLADCPEWLLARCRRKLSEKAQAEKPFTGGQSWGEAALRGLIADLLSQGVGRRNTRLFWVARRIGEISAAGYLDEGFAVSRIRAVALSCGLGEQEADATIESGLRKGRQNPSGPQDQSTAGTYREPPEPTPEPEDRDHGFYSAASLEGVPVPPEEWCVPDVVPMGKVTLLGGDGGTGKSLLAQMLATACATAYGTMSTQWLGRSVRPGRAIYLSAEDDNDELHRRFDRIREAMGLTFGDMSLLLIRSVVGESALLALQDKLRLTETRLMEDLKRCADEAEGLALIVLDTLADLSPVNENDRAAVVQFMGLLKGLAYRHKCAVILLAHPSLAGLNSGSGMSGSTGWNNSARSRLYFTRVIVDGYEADPNKRILQVKKLNSGPVGGEIPCTWSDGVFVADAAETGLDRMASAAKGERVFLRLLRLVNEQERRVNPSGGPMYAPRVFAEHPESEGLTKRAFKSAMEVLLTSGKIKVDHMGPPSRRVSFLVEAS